MIEWDFTVPVPGLASAAPAVPAPAPAPVAPNDAVVRLQRMRPLPSADGKLMVFCWACGEPMYTDEMTAHECDMPAPGWS